jgi:hypothetical protein
MEKSGSRKRSYSPPHFQSKPTQFSEGLKRCDLRQWPRCALLRLFSVFVPFVLVEFAPHKTIPPTATCTQHLRLDAIVPVIVEMLRALVFVTNVHSDNLGSSVEAYFQVCSKIKIVAMTVRAEVVASVDLAISSKNFPVNKQLATEVAVAGVSNVLRNRFATTHPAVAASVDLAGKESPIRK